MNRGRRRRNPERKLQNWRVSCGISERCWLGDFAMDAPNGQGESEVGRTLTTNGRIVRVVRGCEAVRVKFASSVGVGFGSVSCSCSCCCCCLCPVAPLVSRRYPFHVSSTSSCVGHTRHMCSDVCVGGSRFVCGLWKPSDQARHAYPVAIWDQAPQLVCCPSLALPAVRLLHGQRPPHLVLGFLCLWAVVAATGLAPWSIVGF